MRQLRQVGFVTLQSSRSISLAVFIAVLAVPLAITGCTTLRISHRQTGTTTSPTSVPGVPFYVKRARCRQEVVWFEPIYTLTLAALLPDKEGTLQSRPRGAIVLSRSNFRQKQVNDFTKLLNNGPTDEGTVIREWKKVVVLASSQVLAQDFASLATDDRILVGRSAAPAVYVDYADQYYVNAKAPLAGSANVATKVAEDGSLSEISGQVENKTLETILSALPISSVITGELGLAGKALAPTGEVEAFQLTVTISGYRHTLARTVEYPKDGTACTAVSDVALQETTEYKREDIAAADDTTKKAKNTDSNSEKNQQTKTGAGDKGTAGSSGKDSTGESQEEKVGKGDTSTTSGNNATVASENKKAKKKKP